jgi:TRAP-type C4-dicarboxylate transport system permease small subunit
MVYRLGRLLSRCIDIASLIAGTLIVVMMVQVAVDVVARSLLGRPLPATTVFISQYYMLFVVFLALALPERTNAHIGVELVTERMPKRVQYHLASWVHLFCAIIYAFMAKASWPEALKKLDTNASVIESGINVPIWPGYFIVPIGCGLMAIVLLYRFIIYLTGWKSGLGETPVPGAEKAGVEAR